MTLRNKYHVNLLIGHTVKVCLKGYELSKCLQLCKHCEIKPICKIDEVEQFQEEAACCGGVTYSRRADAS